MTDWLFDDGGSVLTTPDYLASCQGPVLGAWEAAPPTPIYEFDDDIAPLLLGANDDDSTTVEPVIITVGQTPHAPGGGYDGRQQDTASITDEAPDETLPCTPPFEGTAPDGVDMDKMRDLAREAADDIRNNNTDWEWGALFYLDQNGELHATRLVTQQSAETVGFPFGDPSFLPDGATIVGWIHNHPYERGTGAQDRFGADDEAGLNVMREQARDSNGRFSFDPKAITYTLDNATDRLSEFDEKASQNARGTQIGDCGG